MEVTRLGTARRPYRYGLCVVERNVDDCLNVGVGLTCAQNMD